jgi:hypothetical protein
MPLLTRKDARDPDILCPSRLLASADLLQQPLTLTSTGAAIRQLSAPMSPTRVAADVWMCYKPNAGPAMVIAGPSKEYAGISFVCASEENAGSLARTRRTYVLRVHWYVCVRERLRVCMRKCACV